MNRSLSCIIRRMPVTRSSGKLATPNSTPVSNPYSKRKASSSAKKSRVSAGARSPEQLASPSTLIAPAYDKNAEPQALVPAVLTFSFDEAKQHLIAADKRFADIFEKLECKPFENLEQVQPFRSLVSSILGQQISWKAARSITHKFLRLYDSSLPENVTDYMDTEAAKSATAPFPTPEMVLKTDATLLRSAGLSQRKVEYVQDLAARFADGRLSTEKLMHATDEELALLLTQVKGIGRWTVDMFAIFSLRRSNILPVGDLGVQRGMLRWFLALHSPSHGFSLNAGSDSAAKKEIQKNGEVPATQDKDTLPVIVEQTSSGSKSVEDIGALEPASSTLESVVDETSLPYLPTVFTPSVNKILEQPISTPAPLPSKLTPAVMKSRLDSKTKIKGAFLSPDEMSELTKSWEPYRSIGVYYMWSLAEPKVNADVK